ncbi:MAG TPA: hypothetical protein VFA46_02730, partial [Actinomycetes bacterium]|nr:hypothetical protein [Actinomycetes bacterium]
PGVGIDVVEGDLLPVHIQPAYDAHQGPPHAPVAAALIVLQLCWGGPPTCHLFEHEMPTTRSL